MSRPPSQDESALQRWQQAQRELSQAMSGVSAAK